MVLEVVSEPARNMSSIVRKMLPSEEKKESENVQRYSKIGFDVAVKMKRKVVLYFSKFSKVTCVDYFLA